MQNILEKSYLSVKDIKSLIPNLTDHAALQIVKKIRNEMISEGAYLIPSKEYLVPTKRVRKLLQL